MKDEVFCPPYRFRTLRVSYSSLMNRYRLGRVLDQKLYVTPLECAFLLSRKKIIPAIPEKKDEIEKFLSGLPDFDIRFPAYFLLKKAGFIVKNDGREMIIKKRKNGKEKRLEVFRTDDEIDLSSVNGDSDFLLSVVDQDGDVTTFTLSHEEMSGSAMIEAPTIRKQANKIMLEDDESVPLWIGFRKGNIRFLTDPELSYLIRSHRSEDAVRQIYRDLTERGFILKSGFKYGALFRAYQKSIEYHAEYLIAHSGKSLKILDLVRIARISNTVRKKCVIAFRREGKIQYILIKRVKDYNQLYTDQIWASKSSTFNSKSE